MTNVRDTKKKKKNIYIYIYIYSQQLNWQVIIKTFISYLFITNNLPFQLVGMKFVVSIIYTLSQEDLLSYEPDKLSFLAFSCIIIKVDQNIN